MASRLSPIRTLSVESRHACSSAPSGIALNGRPLTLFGELGITGIGGRGREDGEGGEDERDSDDEECRGA